MVAFFRLLLLCDDAHGILVVFLEANGIVENAAKDCPELVDARCGEASLSQIREKVPHLIRCDLAGLFLPKPRNHAWCSVLEFAPGLAAVVVPPVVEFLVLYAGGWLPGAFAWPAGVGDVIVELLAPVVGIAYVSGSRRSAGLLRAWNLFGIGDLVVAAATGFLTSPSRLEILAFDRPNELISAFPLVMIPAFLVPLAVLLHLASLEKLRQTETGPRILNPLLGGGGNRTY